MNSLAQKPRNSGVSKRKFACKADSNKEPFEDLYENRNFLTEQIITCIGNKRSLLDFITKGVQIVQKRLNQQPRPEGRGIKPLANNKGKIGYF
jgi:hypothetical protein